MPQRMYEGYAERFTGGLKELPGELRAWGGNYLVQTRANRIFSKGQALKYWSQGHQPKSLWIEETKYVPKTIEFTATETGFSVLYGRSVSAGDRLSTLLSFSDTGVLERAVAQMDSSIAQIADVNLLENLPRLRRELKDTLSVLTPDVVSQLSEFPPLQPPA